MSDTDTLFLSCASRDTSDKERNGGSALAAEMYALLFRPGLLAPAPDHPGLFLRAKSQSLIKTWAPGTEPKQLDFLEARVVENTLNDSSADTLLLVGLIDDDIPNRRPIDEIRQHAPESDQKIAVPCAERNIGVAKHLLGVLDRSMRCPGGLMKEPKQLSGGEIFLF